MLAMGHVRAKMAVLEKNDGGKIQKLLFGVRNVYMHKQQVISVERV